MAKKFAWLVFAVAFLALAIPSAAYAEREKKIPITCSVTLAVTDPGTSTVRGREVHTRGEKTDGPLDCDVDLLDGALSTSHRSDIRLRQDGTVQEMGKEVLAA